MNWIKKRRIKITRIWMMKTTKGEKNEKKSIDPRGFIVNLQWNKKRYMIGHLQISINVKNFSNFSYNMVLSIYSPTRSNTSKRVWRKKWLYRQYRKSFISNVWITDFTLIILEINLISEKYLISHKIFDLVAKSDILMSKKNKIFINKHLDWALNSIFVIKYLLLT